MRSARTVLTATTGLGLALAVTACGSSATTASTPAPGRSTAGGTSASPGRTANGSTTSSTPSTVPAPSSTTQEVNPSGDISDSQVYVVYHSVAAGFVVRVPEGWSRTGTSTIIFTDKLNSVAIQTRALTAAPTVASVTAGELATVRSAVRGYAAGSVSLVSRTSGPVVRATYQVDSTANPVTGKSVRNAVERYSYWKAGREVVLTLSGPTGADNVDPWRTITDSFRWTR